MSHNHPKRPASNPREEWVCRVFDAKTPVNVRMVGIPYQVEIETAVHPDRGDHVCFTMQVPPCGPVLVSVNTLSRLNRVAGFDARVRVGVVTSAWSTKPAPLLEEFPGLDYTTIEAPPPVA